MPKTAQSVELDAIERLEDKVRRLVSIVEQLRADHARLTGENRTLGDEVATLRKKLVESEGTSSEVAALREEREQIRARVSEMLAQIEALEI
jgi:regulator of replication initiation timing